MSKIIPGNLLDVVDGIICHQVNCQGVMGSGLAKQIKDKYSKAYYDYVSAYDSGHIQLGKVIFSIITTTPYLVIAHICGQDKYGREKGVVYTNYEAVKLALGLVVAHRQAYYEKTFNLPRIFIPFKMGCGLGGGDWYMMNNIVTRIIPDVIIIKPSL